ncbi:hypothetical protein GCK72_020560 [Caenorhabditis remanei]|uniref:G-protein coupled receptors family 1 profile domain-containing protein n=1 Tax=Caenorhabditis remanei TaxID=31234 RepID=A0A6A5GHL4_CAERE|nr:hypothetical protein GCK72_020560 [Caenorhabditis remanei]KAF1754002.1 hypothetical protein GCK72_020560 [Caenorhabditis remanei]
MDEMHISLFSNEIYLTSYCIILVLQLFCAGINGVIIIMFWKLSDLRKNKNFHLVFYFSASDFLAAVFEIPYIIYTILKWNPSQLNFDQLVILISSTPLPLQRKVSAIITIGIAISRNLAIFFPAKFRKLEQSYYSEITLIGIAFGVFDAVLMFISSPITRIPNCGTSGCFVGCYAPDVKLVQHTSVLLLGSSEELLKKGAKQEARNPAEGICKLTEDGAAELC